MEKPKRPRGRPTAESKAQYEKELKEYEENCSQAFVESKLAEPWTRRRHNLKPDEDTLKTIFEFSKMDATQKEIAAVLRVSEWTFSQFMRDCPMAREAYDDGIQYGNLNLRKDQIDMVKKNAAMGIFLGKNKLGQRDETHKTTTINAPVNEMTQEQLMEIAFGGAKARSEPKKVTQVKD